MKFICIERAPKVSKHGEMTLKFAEREIKQVELSMHSTIRVNLSASDAEFLLAFFKKPSPAQNEEALQERLLRLVKKS